MDVLAPIRSRPANAGIFTDFDGTLSEIAPTPQEARPAPGGGEALEALAATYGLVVVVSGRRAAEVARLLGSPPGVRCFGLYGLEDQQGPADPAATELMARIEALLPQVEGAAASVPGAVVEPKGLQVAVHYRGADDPASARRVLVDRLGDIAGRSGLRLLEGKKVVELAPQGGPTKGDVVVRMAEERSLEAVLYAGDDLADLEAFAAVDRLRDRGLSAATIAVRSAETPEELASRADLIVDGPGALVRLLRGLT